MNFRDLARQFDRSDSPRESAWAYEISLQDPGATLDVYLDLVALYLFCQDGGYVAANQLDSEFVGAAYNRIAQLLDAAEQRFGVHTEISFWRLYVPEQVLGHDVPDEQYEALVATGGSLLPCYRLYLSSGGAAYQREVKHLYDLISDGDTARKRWIRGTLQSAELPMLQNDQKAIRELGES